MSDLDLNYSREIILDYIRMQMCEEVFHLAIVKQIKDKVKDKFSGMRQSAEIESTDTVDRRVDETVEVEYMIGNSPKSKNIVLFRIKISLMKIPNQFTYVTVNELIDCIETFLSPCDRDDIWLPTVEDRLVRVKWDKKAMPIPLLVLEQLEREPFALEK